MPFRRGEAKFAGVRGGFSRRGGESSHICELTGEARFRVALSFGAGPLSSSPRLRAFLLIRLRQKTSETCLRTPPRLPLAVTRRP